MRLDELNWMDVERYLQTEDRIMLILGACEQHGYLSLLTDIRIPQALADAASRQTGVLAAPPLNFGASSYFLAYPGTISLRATTLMDVAEDLVRSLHRQGFRRFLVLNGHGGNDAASDRLSELAGMLPDLHVQWYEWWSSHSVEALAIKHEIKPAHANWLEAFPFTMVGELPEGSKVPARFPGIVGPDQARAAYGDGSLGGPYRASEQIMQEIFDACLLDVLQMLKFE